jgi:hypothetical protein
MNNTRKFAVVTTFNQAGLTQYGQRMIDSFLSSWPADVDLLVYAENCQPTVPSTPRVKVIDLNTVMPLTAFKKRWANVPYANGDISRDPIRSRRKDSNKNFKWNAVRFAHKVYAIFHAAKQTDADILIWMDADMICHSAISLNDVSRLCPQDKDLCYLGRRGKYSECGLYAMNLRSASVQMFLEKFQNAYDFAEQGIFTYDEWHDSFVFDQIRNSMQLRELNWSDGLGDLRPSPRNSPGEGHPLINSEWGTWLDHLKGDRKQTGRSWAKDLVVNRNEAYWK